MYYTEARIICIRIYIYIYFITVVVEFVALHRVLPPSIAAVVETIRTGYDRKLNNKKKEKKEKKESGFYETNGRIYATKMKLRLPQNLRTKIDKMKKIL